MLHPKTVDCAVFIQCGFSQSYCILTRHTIYWHDPQSLLINWMIRHMTKNGRHTMYQLWYGISTKELVKVWNFCCSTIPYLSIFEPNKSQTHTHRFCRAEPNSENPDSWELSSQTSCLTYQCFIVSVRTYGHGQSWTVTKCWASFCSFWRPSCLVMFSQLTWNVCRLRACFPACWQKYYAICAWRRHMTSDEKWRHAQMYCTMRSSSCAAELWKTCGRYFVPFNDCPWQ